MGEIQRRHKAIEEEQEKWKKNKEVAEENKPANDLQAGKPLPFFYGDPPPELLNTPLEELDPFYQSQKTFIVLGKGNIIHRFNAAPACYLLSPTNLLRDHFLNTQTLFSLFILVTILTNCVFMTMTHPPEWSIDVKYAFIAIYTLDAVIKIVSKGFCVGKFTFLRDPWNWLDILIISTTFLTEFVDLGKVSVLGIIPRILKLITVIPGLKTTVGALVQSVKRLADVIVLMLFCLSVFALIGLQLFMGRLKHKCVMWPPGNLTLDYYDPETLSSNFHFHRFINDPENQYFLPHNFDALVCGNSSDATICPEGFVCMRTDSNPNFGYTSYDSFGWSLLSLFRLMTHDFWENLMQLTLQATGKIYLIFFAPIVFPGSFIFLSFILAMVAMVTREREEASVSETKQREEEFNQILEALERSEEDEVSLLFQSVSIQYSPLFQIKINCFHIRSEHKGFTECCSHYQLCVSELQDDRRSCPPCWSVFFDLFLKWNCCGCWRWLKQWLYTFITNPFFDFVIVLCLIVNIIFMAMEHFPMSPVFEEQLSVAQLVFTGIFTAEMVIKLVALDPYGFFQVGWNVFEGIIVTVSLLYLFVDVPPHWLLLMRVFRLARWWPSFHVFLKIIWTSVRVLRNLILILLIVVFLFTVVGMQLFHNDYKDCVCRISHDCELPRWHMNDFFHTFLIMVRILYGQWVETLWYCMEVSGQAVCLIFFMTFLVVGHLLSYILPLEADSKEDDRKEYLALNSVDSVQPGTRPAPIATVEIGEEQKKQKRNMEWVKGCCPCLEIDTSLWSNFRRACFSIVQHKYFEIFMIVIVLLSSVALVFEDVYLQQRQVLKAALEVADQFFTCVFLLEMLLKWIGLGLKKYFSSAWCWLDFLILNVSLVCLTANLVGFFELGVFHSLRALLPLRALSRCPGPKLVVQSLVRSLLSMFGTLLVFLTVWLIFSVLGVNLFAGKFHYCYNTTSEEMFTPEDVENRTQCVSLIYDDHIGVTWRNKEFNFDSVSSGYLTLLLLATAAQWMTVMYAAVDSRESLTVEEQLPQQAVMQPVRILSMVESQPVYEANLYMYLYFICFIIINFFILNVFIRVIIDNLLRDKIQTHSYMTEEQQKFSKGMKKVMNKPLRAVPRPQNRCQALLFDLVTSRWFEVFMVVMVCLNMVPLMVETDDQSYEKEKGLYWLHFVFIIIFLTEFVLKVIAFRQHYFTDGWNILDFVVIVVSIVGLFLANILDRYLLSPHVFPVLRLARICRFLHLIRCARRIRKLLLAFLMSLPALLNIGLVLLLIMFTYSIFGMLNFAYVRKEALINGVFNFETFWSSLTCVFAITTSPDWGGLLMPIMNKPPYCDPFLDNPGLTVRGDCGSPVTGIIFFTTYIALSFLLVVHLYIAVILETFNAEDTELLCDDDLQGFYKTWRKFDPDALQSIQYSELSDFCDTLQGPLRIPKPNTIKLIHMDLPLVHGDKIHCVDVLRALASQVTCSHIIIVVDDM
ncbi:hypothetical protein L3Q82_023484, partial [Scortum barcoo]